MKGDYVLVSDVWFEMMNSAPQRRSLSAAESSISDLGGNDAGLARDGRAGAGGEIEGRTRDRSALGNVMAEPDERLVWKPRPIQTRYAMARSTSYSSGKLQKSHRDVIENGKGVGVGIGRRDWNGDRDELTEEEKFQIPKPGYHAGCSTCVSSSEFCDSDGGIDGDCKARERGKVGSGIASGSEHRNGHALVNGVYHQMLKPGQLAPRPRNKLQKTQKGIKSGRDGSVGDGSKGTRSVIS